MRFFQDDSTTPAMQVWLQAWIILNYMKYMKMRTEIKIDEEED